MIQVLKYPKRFKAYKTFITPMQAIAVSCSSLSISYQTKCRDCTRFCHLGTRGIKKLVETHSPTKKATLPWSNEKSIKCQ